VSRDEDDWQANVRFGQFGLAGQAHDLTCAEPLLESVDPGAVLGDKGFDADPFIDALERRDIAPVIPPKANRKVPRSCDFVLYCERNLVEPMALEGRRGVFGEIKPPASGLQLPTGGNIASPDCRLRRGRARTTKL
jgi:hypothetical protein